MIKFLVQLLCLFVPVNEWRKAIRRKLVERRKGMIRFHKIADWKIEKVEGIKVATGMLRNGATIRLAHVFGKDISAVHAANEVFSDNGYHFAARGKVVVVDIGMNCGYASLYFAVRSDVEAVYAFEPVKPVYEKALFSFSLNECAKKITAHNYGLGDSNREIMINFNSMGSGTTSTMPECQSAGKTMLTVQIKEAAAEIRNIIVKHPGQKIIMKCDCEGAEKEIFARLDAENILPSIDAIVMEYHCDYDQFVEPILHKHGFIYFKFTSEFQNRGIGMIRAVNRNNNQ